MNTNNDKMFYVQLIEEANSQARLKLIASLNEKICRLRESYKANQTNIREIESWEPLANQFENLQKDDREITRMLERHQGVLEGLQIYQNEICNSSNPVSEVYEAQVKLIKARCLELKTGIRRLKVKQEQISIELKVSREAVKLLTALNTLRDREREIKEEGARLNEELKSLQEIELLKSSNFSHNQIPNSETQISIVKEVIVCNVGSKCLRLAEFLFSSKTCREVFYPSIGDRREDYIIALRKGRVFDAIFISLKIYLDFSYSMILCSRLGKAIEFILKFADAIELFNKFSK